MGEWGNGETSCLLLSAPPYEYLAIIAKYLSESCAETLSNTKFFPSYMIHRNLCYLNTPTVTVPLKLKLAYSLSTFKAKT